MSRHEAIFIRYSQSAPSRGRTNRRPGNCESTRDTLLTTLCKLRVATSYSFASYDVKYTPAETKVTWTAGLYSLPKSESTFFSSSF
jgi:hypothetical protein